MKMDIPSQRGLCWIPYCWGVNCLFFKIGFVQSNVQKRDLHLPSPDGILDDSSCWPVKRVEELLLGRLFSLRWYPWFVHVTHIPHHQQYNHQDEESNRSEVHGRAGSLTACHYRGLPTIQSHMTWTLSCACPFLRYHSLLLYFEFVDVIINCKQNSSYLEETLEAHWIAFTIELESEWFQLTVSPHSSIIDFFQTLVLSYPVHSLKTLQATPHPFM